MIDAAAAKDLGVAEIERRWARGAGGDVEVSLGAVRTIEVGGAAVSNLTCIVSDISGIAEKLGGRVDGVLGFDFLSKFRITIDYAARRLTLERTAGTVDTTARIEGDRFVHPAAGLSVTRPGPEWDFVTETPLPQIIVTLGRRGGTASAKFQVQELHGLTLEQVWPDVREAIALQFDAFRELDAKPTRLSDHDARQIEFTGRQAGTDRRVRLIAVMTNNRLWTVTCGADQPEFASREAEFRAIVDGVRLSPPPDRR